MKLEIKHIAPYLPYELKCFDIETKEIGVIDDLLYSIDAKPFRKLDLVLGSQYVKPLLRPMSDLYREIDGKIGIVELAKIATNNTSGWELLNGIATNIDKGMNFVWNTFTEGFDLGSIGNHSLNQIINQLALFEWLFANHYDVFDLIGQNLAIDKNSIEDERI